MKMPRKSKDSRVEARVFAFKLLGYRARSSKEMLDRLTRKGFSEEDVTSTMVFLEETGLIDDETLASDLFSYSVEKKTLGKQGIRMFLAKRGIDKGLIEKNLSRHTTEMEEKSALDFVEKKLRTLKNYPDDIIKRKLWGMLQRRGVSVDVIKRVVNSSM